MQTNIIQNHSANQLQRTQFDNKINKQKGPGGEKTPSAASAAPRYDEYVHGADNAEETAGIYKVAEDANGKPQVTFDKPQDDRKAKPADDDEKTADSAAPASPDGKDDEIQKCTANTDKVDAEIKKLKEEKQKLEQQISRAADNPDQVKALKSQLSNVESELQMKDNDNYRRQHTTFTNSTI